MKKPELSAALKRNHAAFTQFVNGLNEADFTFSLNGEKWSAGQQYDHIRRSVKPLNLAFMLPTFILKWQFGKANRPSRTYEELVQRYKDKLYAGARATSAFIPLDVTVAERESISTKLNKSVERLSRQINGFSEEQLDNCILPHPLLGKITLREMLYFTIFHCEHHHHSSSENLTKR